MPRWRSSNNQSSVLDEIGSPNFVSIFKILSVALILEREVKANKISIMIVTEMMDAVLADTNKLEATK